MLDLALAAVVLLLATSFLGTSLRHEHPRPARITALVLALLLTASAVRIAWPT